MTFNFIDNLYGQRLLSICNRQQIERIIKESDLEVVRDGFAKDDFVVVRERAGMMIKESKSDDFPEDTAGYVLVQSSDLPYVLKKVRRFEWFHASNGKVYLDGKWETSEEERRIWYRQKGRENLLYLYPERYEGLEIIHLRNEGGKIVFSYADRRNSLQKTVKKLWYYWDKDCREVDSLRFANEEIAGLDFGSREKLRLQFENCKVKNVSLSEIKDLSFSLANCQLEGVSITKCDQTILYLKDTQWCSGSIRDCDRLEIFGSGIVFENYAFEKFNLSFFDVRNTRFKSCNFHRCGLEGFASWVSKLEEDFELLESTFSYCSFDQKTYDDLLRTGSTLIGRNFPKPDLSVYPFVDNEERYMLRLGIQDEHREWEIQVDLLEGVVYNYELKCPIYEFEELIGKLYISEEHFNYDPDFEDFILKIMPIIQTWHEQEKRYRE